MSIVVVAALTGCALTGPLEQSPAPDVQITGEGQIRPLARPETLNTSMSAPPVAARTVEEFDTTTAQQRSEAVAEAATEGGEVDLGRTIASLGSPTEPGFWLKTPLVSAPSKGRVVYPVSGKSVAVDLIPIDGPKTAGSRMSLPAMRLIEAPLTELPEVQVFRVSG
ncbi:hypothetical protein [Roseovarius faecimaris]|nr:hypothetical protein [Roseovarius faecimaris]